jgi:hypothetical protein
MKLFSRALAAIALVIVFSAFASDQTPTVDLVTVAKIREEGLSVPRSWTSPAISSTSSAPD